MNGGDGISSVFSQGSADYPCSLLRCCSAVEAVEFRPGTNDLCSAHLLYAANLSGGMKCQP
jgi:hypothetical protein